MSDALRHVDDVALRGGRRGLAAFRASYGSSPVQLIALLLSFVVAVMAAHKVLEFDPVFWWRYALWFVGAALVHDLVLFPVYGVLDGVVGRALRSRPRLPADTVNFLRVPAMFSGVLFLCFGATILGRGTPAFVVASGKTQDGFLARWLLITAVLFAVSGLLYVVRLLRARSASTSAST